MKIKTWMLILIAGLFLSVMAVFMFVVMKGDSATTDESIHVLSGYEYWRGRFSVNPEHPPLGKQIATIPLNFIKPTMPSDVRYEKAIKDFYYDSWAETREYSQKWLFKTPDNDADQIVNSSRTVVMIFTLILGLLIFYFALKWYGWLAAVISLFLYSFSPLFLTHGHLANTDLWMTFGFFIAIISFAYYLSKPKWLHLILAAVCFAIAILLKYSAILLAPILILLWLVYRYRSDDRKKYNWKNFLLILVTLSLVTLLLIWADYGFPTDTAPKFVVDSHFEYTNKALQVFSPVLQHLPVPQYFKGLIMVFATSISQRPAYLLGQFSYGGWWYYFPIAFLVKEPLAFIILLLAGVGFWIGWSIDPRSRPAGRKKLEFRDWLLIIPPAFYIFVTLFSKLNIGIRHLMPIYPFLFIFVGYFVSEFYERYKKSVFGLPAGKAGLWFLVFGFMLATWYLWASISVYPYFMTYFNELAGGPKGGSRILLDSNLDWGQDMKRLVDWLKKEGIKEPVKMEYFWAGLDQADYYGLNYQLLKENDPNQKGWIVIGVSSLQRPQFSWLKNYQPFHIIGNSVYVYHIE